MNSWAELSNSLHIERRSFHVSLLAARLISSGQAKSAKIKPLMKIRLLAALALFVGSFCAPVMAQDETIILSPFSISSAKRSAKPPVVVKKRADFLLLEISLVNDSREEERRRTEVYTTLKSLLKGVPAGSKIELFTEEFTLTPAHYQIPLFEVAEKRDTSRVTLYAKIPLSESDDVGALAESLRTFVGRIKGDGRTEIFSGELGLSIKNPEKYRYEVVQAVAADVKKLRESFGDSFEIIVTGLDSRLEWERTTVSEIELYLPMKYEVFPVKGSKVMMKDE
jgi:hypothetical protein